MPIIRNILPTSNSYTFIPIAPTSTGNSIGRTVSSTDIAQGFYVTDNSGSINSIYRPNGIGLSDFNKGTNNDVQFVLDWSKYVDTVTGNLLKSDGNIFYSLNSQVNPTTGTYGTVSAWDAFTTYSPGNQVIYYDKTNTNVYTCLQTTSPGITDNPVIEVNYWEFTDSIFNLRFVPAENSINPLLKGNKRFNYYATATCFAINATNPNAYRFKLNSSEVADVYGPAVAVDGAKGAPPLKIPLLTGSVTTGTTTVTHDSTVYPAIVGQKVVINGYDYSAGSGPDLPFTATVTGTPTATGFTATINTLGNWSAGTTYNYGDFVTYTVNSGVYVNIRTSSTTVGFVPTNTTYWKRLTGSFDNFDLYADALISSWDIVIDKDTYYRNLTPQEAFANAKADFELYSGKPKFKYEPSIVNHKQILFNTSDYIVHNGFPFDKGSIDGAEVNVSGYILPSSQSILSREIRPLLSTTVTSDLPTSDNRYRAQASAPVLATANVTQTVVNNSVYPYVTYTLSSTVGYSVGDQVTITGITTNQGATPFGFPIIEVTNTTISLDIDTAIDGTYTGLSGTATVTRSSTFPLSAPYTYDWVPSQGNFNTLYSFTGLSGDTQTAYPDLLDGTASSNSSGNILKLQLITPDNNDSALTEINSMSFANNQFFITNYNPFKINRTSLNDFTTFVVGYFDYVSDDDVDYISTGYNSNFYGIMSEATVSRITNPNTNIFVISSVQATDPLLSVRYLINGVITLNLGDRVLTSIQSVNGAGRPKRPMAVGVTISQANKTATLIVVDDYYKSASASFKRSIVNPTNLIYGAAPFSNRLHAAKMYVMEINNYYSTKTEEELRQEVQIMDAMHAITSGRTL